MPAQAGATGRRRTTGRPSRCPAAARLGASGCHCQWHGDPGPHCPSRCPLVTRASESGCHCQWHRDPGPHCPGRHGAYCHGGPGPGPGPGSWQPVRGPLRLPGWAPTASAAASEWPLGLSSPHLGEVLVNTGWCYITAKQGHWAVDRSPSGDERAGQKLMGLSARAALRISGCSPPLIFVRASRSCGPFRDGHDGSRSSALSLLCAESP
jgi:hypothetical protein